MFLKLLLLAAISLMYTGVHADILEAMELQRQRLEQVQELRGFVPPSRGTFKRQDGSAISFANPRAEQFFVDGTSIPDGRGLSILCLSDKTDL